MRVKRTGNYPHGVMVGTCAHLQCHRPRRSHQLCETHARYLRAGRSIAHVTLPRRIKPVMKRPIDLPPDRPRLDLRTVDRLLWLGWGLDRIAEHHAADRDAIAQWLAQIGRDDLLRRAA